MYESGAIWTLTATDGTAVSFNGGGVFYLEEVTGFDSPNIRQNLEDLPEQDGAAAGSFFMGSRPVTFRGRVFATTAAARNLAVVQLQAALRGLRGDITITSQAQGLPAMQAYARLDNIRVTGGYAKDFIVALVCADPLIYSQALSTGSGTGDVASSGAVFLLVFPIDFGGGVGTTVSLTVTNAGNFASPPTVRVTGPITAPQLTNATTGASLYLDNVTLAAGEYIDVDMAAKTVVKDDGTNFYSRVRLPASRWWTLSPGANQIQLWSTGSPTSATLAVTWRDAWA